MARWSTHYPEEFEQLKTMSKLLYPKIMHFIFPLGVQLTVSSKDMPEIAVHHKNNSHSKTSQIPNPSKWVDTTDPVNCSSLSSLLWAWIRKSKEQKLALLLSSRDKGSIPQIHPREFLYLFGTIGHSFLAEAMHTNFAFPARWWEWELNASVLPDQ